MIESWEKHYCLEAAKREKFRPPGYQREVYDSLVQRGYLEKYTIRYKHIFYYRLTELGKEAINGKS